MYRYELSPIVILFVAVELGSLACAVHLWRRPDGGSWTRRGLWTLVALLPVLGPLLYGGVFKPPRPLKGAAQNSEHFHGPP